MGKLDITLQDIRRLPRVCNSKKENISYNSHRVTRQSSKSKSKNRKKEENEKDIQRWKFDIQKWNLLPQKSSGNG